VIFAMDRLIFVASAHRGFHLGKTCNDTIFVTAIPSEAIVFTRRLREMSIGNGIRCHEADVTDDANGFRA
jgi:hypothetical protein